MPTKLHAYVDYVIALFSILSPLILGFGEGGTETMVPICFGMLLILYNFFTDYPLGLSKQIPLYAHLRMDQVAGLLMVASPWMLRFHEVVYAPHVLLGFMLVISSLLSGDDIPNLIHAIRNKEWEKLFRVPSEQ